MRKGIDYVGVGVGGVIVDEAGRILLLKRTRPPESGSWTVPGGSVEYAERVTDALQRELREELGVEVEIIRLLTLVDHIVEKDRMHFVSLEYLVRIAAGVPENLEPTKHSDMQWHPLSDLPTPLSMTAQRAIEVYRCLESHR